MTDYGLMTPDEYRALYYLISDEMARRIRGHGHAVHALSLAGTRHLAAIQAGSVTGGARILLIGPSGVGKTHIMTTLADVLAVPLRRVDATMLAQQNWQGTQITDHLQALYDEHGPAVGQHAIILLDEIDKVCARDSTGSSRDYQLGRQTSLLPLVGVGSEIPLKGGQRCRPDGMFIVMAGVFAGLPPGLVGPGDLLRLGLMHELVERVGSIIRLEPLPLHELVHVLRAGLSEHVETYRHFGYVLEIDAETLSYVATCLASRVDEAGPRSGISWLRAGADRQLCSLLEGEVPPGIRVTLRPDDVTIPPAFRRPGGETPPPART